MTRLVQAALLADCDVRLKSEDHRVRLAAISVLVTASDPEGRGITTQQAREAAAMGMQDLDPDMRRLAVRAFAHVAGPEDSEALQRTGRLLEDPSWPVRWAAVDAMTHVSGSAGCSTTAELLTTRMRDKDWPVRRAAVSALAKVAEAPEVIAAITDLLRDEQEDVRIAVVRTLAQLSAPGDMSVIAALSDRLADRHASVRRAAAVGLGQLANRGDAGVLAPLHRAARDKDDDVRMAAQLAMDRLSP